MKKIVLIISSFLIIGLANAQSNYLVHTIKDGETLTKLANKYGTTVGDIMRLNQMNTDSKLSIGEKVKIPKSGDGNVTTHAVAKGETLYSIARKNHVTVAQLRDWNNIPDNTIHDGQILRLTAPDNSVSTDNSSTAAIPATPTNNDATTGTTDNTAATSDATAGNTSDAQVATDDNKTRADESTATTATPVNQNSDEGAFAIPYQSTANGTELITKGSSGLFKTASGWQDKKYYILMNDITPGKIVKVQANGKTVYAKVLWNLGNVKENQGLSYRISDAAASLLNVSGNSFDIIVSYYK